MKTQGAWWMSITWLLLGLGVLLYFALRWMAGIGDPLRNELGIAVTMAFIYTLPAAISVSVLALAKFGFAKTQRRLGASGRVPSPTWHLAWRL